MRTSWLLAGSVVSLFVAACSASPERSSGPFGSSDAVPAPAPPPASAANAKTIAYMEGSFDGTTKTFTVVYRNAVGAIMPEATLPYGEGAGDVYLHTSGTHGDGYSNGTFAPPTVQSGNLVEWQMAAENGTGAAITNFTFCLDSVTPPTVTFAANSTSSPATCDNTGASPTPAPCTSTFGTFNGSPTVVATPGFPTPDNVNTMEAIFDDSANSGGSFTFGAHLTGN